LADVTLIPVPVQGAEAAPAMIAALGLLNRQARLDPARDAILITRGGGSLEDLWAFNNEHLARAIFHSRLPVMSAVGHEVDTTLADYAADLRAPTPSAAAERLVPDGQALAQALARHEARLARAMQARLERDSQRLDGLRARLRHPGERLAQQRHHVDALAQRLHRAARLALAQQQQRVTQLARRMESQDMARLHQGEQTRLTQLSRRLEGAMTRGLHDHRARLNSAARELNAVSPLAVLGRGYAIAQDEAGQVVRRAKDVTPGQALSLRLGEGRLSVEVKRRHQQ
ncbi:exodeoxyribonuclease VII large subunit, partial [Halomonas sp. 707D4]